MLQQREGKLLYDYNIYRIPSEKVGDFMNFLEDRERL